MADLEYITIPPQPLKGGGSSSGTAMQPNWYDGILNLGQDVWEWLGRDENAEASGAFLGLAGTALDWFENDQKKAGYQGKIPRYTAVREQLPEFDPDRRAGGGGQRYFTDVYYGQTPEEQQTVGSLEDAQAAADAQKAALVAQNPEQFAMGGIVNALMPMANYNQGGIVNALQQAYLDGPSDGMADRVPATIDNQRPARLSHGEMVIPADVVSHMGNGNSEAGAQQFYDMMDRVRKARTGSEKQGKQINPNKFIPR